MLSLMGISYKRMESSSGECSINDNLYNRINRIKGIICQIGAITM